MVGFEIHGRVRVKSETTGSNRRVPRYIRGKTGIIVKAHGVVPNYEHDHADSWGPLYSVLFDAREIPGFSPTDKILLDIHESWLETVE